MGNKVVDIPAKQIPPLKFQLADQAGVKQILITAYGGLGDQVCAEPAMRAAFKIFKGREISLLASHPDIYSHLPFKNVYRHEEATKLIDDEWIVLHTYMPDFSLAADFIAHHFTQAVDYATLCALQRQLPITEREIKLTGDRSHGLKHKVVVHPGRHWPANTFPKAWWDEVIERLVLTGCDVAIVGKHVTNGHGTVDVAIPKGCTDLRNQLSVKGLVGLLQDAQVVLTNDSGPLHVAASGNAEILFMAGSKGPDYLTHWRGGQFGQGMKNLNPNGLWSTLDTDPIRPEALDMSQPYEHKGLPSPASVVYEVRKALI
jgi:ADP-heptose:LPS heptosyltransferase